MLIHEQSHLRDPHRRHPNSRRSFLCTLCVVLIYASLAGGCRHEQSVERPPTPVRVQAVKEHAGDGGVRYSAIISPYAQVDLTFKVGGYIREILQVRGADGRLRDAQQGDVFPKGTVLAQIREKDFIERINQAKAQLARAQASLQKAKQDWGRATNLFATHSMTKPDYDAARAQFDEAQATVAGARAQLEEAGLDLQYCALTTPMDGVVLQRKIEVGTLATPGLVGFVFADLSSVKAVFGVPDVMLARLQLGSPLAIVTESIRGVAFPGRITAISPAADANSRVFSVEVTVPNPRLQLKAGAIASLQVADGKLPAPVPVAPLSAVIGSPTDPNGYAVFVVQEENGRTVGRIRNVQLGDVYGNAIAVTAGVQVGEQVIVTGATLVADGEPVQIIP
ncbi:MAG: efflux RND transporter periplasmic adaptor subunit [Candidatus Binatia bacterium]